MKIGRRKFLKYLAFAGAIATMGHLGYIVSKIEPIPYERPTLVKEVPKPALAAPVPTPTPTPTPKPLAAPVPTPTPIPTPTPKPLAAEPTPTSTPTTKKFTESKRCPQCWIPTPLLLVDIGGKLWWVCKECSYIEIVKEPEILRKYGYLV